jgi:phosphatidylinositol-3-phosphatase
VIRRGAILAAIALGVAGGWGSVASADVPHVNHVFIVMLENENAADTFGPKTEIPYLADTLAGQGAYVKNYYGTGHLSLDNYISMVSGQAPNPDTQADCPFYSNFQPGLPSSDGQLVGAGCVYPPGVQNIATQLEGNGYTWRGYMQDMASSAPAQPASCRHPALNSSDSTQTAKPNDQYAARHNPFVYFHSIIDLPTCQANDVDLSRLGRDLQSEATTPDYALISPDLCNDGHDEPCADGSPGGMKQANGFLKSLIPQITSSAAYQDRGLIIVTFDEAEATGSTSDGSSCCGEQSGPNTPAAGGPTGGSGGGRIGAVMLSNCIQPGTVSSVPYNHYSQLRSIEDNFGLAHLGYAAKAGLKPFGTDILNVPSCPRFATPCKPRRKHKKRHRHAAAASKHHKHKLKKCKKKRRKRKH